MLHEKLLSFLKEFFHPGPKQLLLSFEHHSLTCYVQNRLQLQWVNNSGYRPQVCEGYVLTPICQSFCSRGRLHPGGLGRPPSPQSDTTGYGQRAGMYSCVLNEFGESRKKST